MKSAAAMHCRLHGRPCLAMQIRGEGMHTADTAKLCARRTLREREVVVGHEGHKTVHARDHGRVRQQHALGVARGAGGVHDGADVLWRRGVLGHGLRGAVRQERLVRDALHAALLQRRHAGLHCGGVGAPVADALEGLLDLGQGGREGCHFGGRDDEELGLGVVDDVLDGVLSQRVVQRHALERQAVAGLHATVVLIHRVVLIQAHCEPAHRVAASTAHATATTRGGAQ